MRQPNFYSAVFAIIKNEFWEILFQKRQNTWFRDWMYQLPCGHLEEKETMKWAIIRELKEEINIDVLEEDVNILHIAHTLSVWKTYFNIYVEVLRYSWILENLEPEKCCELVFKDFEEIKNDEKYEYEVETLNRIFAWEKFSEKVNY